MNEISIKNILGIPEIYNLFKKLIVRDLNALFYKPYIRAKKNDVILDIGCGPAEVLDYLPEDVQYYGFDFSSRYIKKAQAKYKNRKAVFKNEAILNTNLSEELKSKCDIVIAIGVIHHLTDAEVIQLYSLSKLALRAGGRLITIDPCFIDNQSIIAQYIAFNDRGKYVRHINKYKELATNNLDDSVKLTITNNFLRIPSCDNLIMEWIKGE